MTKQEAIEAMKSGKKVTHTSFTNDEWITMGYNFSIVTEDGYGVNGVDFWMDRQSDSFENGWSIYGK